jgi:hypothetical protein
MILLWQWTISIEIVSRSYSRAIGTANSKVKVCHHIGVRLAIAEAIRSYGRTCTRTPTLTLFSSTIYTKKKWVNPLILRESTTKASALTGRITCSYQATALGAHTTAIVVRGLPTAINGSACRWNDKACHKMAKQRRYFHSLVILLVVLIFNDNSPVVNLDYGRKSPRLLT